MTELGVDSLANTVILEKTDYEELAPVIVDIADTEYSPSLQDLEDKYVVKRMIFESLFCIHSNMLPKFLQTIPWRIFFLFWIEVSSPALRRGLGEVSKTFFYFRTILSVFFSCYIRKQIFVLLSAETFSKGFRIRGQ